jgi:hypothetical protein
MSNEKEWFKLENVETIIGNDVNNFEELRKELNYADKIGSNSWRLSYIKINATLIFMGKLNTPNGEVDTEFTYYIKTNYEDMKKQAKITIYEQTFTGLDEAVTIRFSSGSIISKIVFGDIEKCYTQLKEEVIKQIKEYNKKVDDFNEEIKKLKQAKKEEENNE